MKIETKFEINQIVYYLFDNKVTSSPVREIHISVYKSELLQIKYFVTDGNGGIRNLSEDVLFSSKEKLKNSLWWR